MDYYRDPRTGELLRFDRSAIAWTELRCDATTQYVTRWVDTAPPVDPGRFIFVSRDEADQYQREVDQANSAARGELLLNQMSAARRRRLGSGSPF